MSTHTKVNIETMNYECAERDCAHVSPIGSGECPTFTWECCKECSDRNWDECEGPVITWDECGGTGATFAEVDAEDAHTFEADRAQIADLPFRCPACGWSTRNREVEQHVCPGSSDPFGAEIVGDVEYDSIRDEWRPTQPTVQDHTDGSQ